MNPVDELEGYMLNLEDELAVRQWELNGLFPKQVALIRRNTEPRDTPSFRELAVILMETRDLGIQYFPRMGGPMELVAGWLELMADTDDKKAAEP